MDELVARRAVDAQARRALVAERRRASIRGSAADGDLGGRDGQLIQARKALATGRADGKVGGGRWRVGGGIAQRDRHRSLDEAGDREEVVVRLR